MTSARRFPNAPQVAQLIEKPQWNEYGEQYLHGSEPTYSAGVRNQGRTQP